MPAPSSASWLRPDLREYFEALPLAALQEGFSTLEVLPPQGVTVSASANISTIPQSTYLKRVDTQRKARAAYPRLEWTFGQDNFSTAEHGLEVPQDDNDRATYSYTGIEFDMIEAELSRYLCMLDMEIAGAAALQSTATFENTGATLAWDDYASADPLADLLAATLAFRDLYGLPPNTVVIPWKAAARLKLCASVSDRLKYWGGTDPAGIKEGVVLSYFRDLGLERVIVPRAIYNSANEGLSVSLTDIWDPDKVSLYYVREGLPLRGVGRSFFYTGDGADERGAVEQYRSNERRGDVVRFRFQYDQKVLDSNAGYIITGCET